MLYDMANGNLSFILLCAEKIVELGTNWYKNNAEWRQFPLQVERLRTKLDFWEREFLKRGLSSNAALSQSLSAARSCVEEEQRKLETKEATFGSKCWRHVGRTLLPSQVGLSLQGAIDAFDNIQQVLEFNDQAKEALDRTLKNSPFSESITNDDRYVPFLDSERKIFEALDNGDGSPVVLLHGGAGKGKSTVARNTVVHYLSQSRFDHVFLLNCGPRIRIEDTHLELIQRLGSQPLADLQDDEKTRSIPIRKQVKSLLAEQKVLLILDDVSDGEFLRKIVELCGCGVKCLVTSQLGSLCRSLDRSKYISVRIQDIGQHDARKILASHSGLPNHCIPAHLQRIADRMIAETDFNPLALASLASVIDQTRSEELSEWEDASTNFFQALKSEVPVALFHGKYPRSLWATMGLTISTLNEDARNLLLLTHACEGPSVPEEVIQILYTRCTKLQGYSRTFSSVRSELESRQLIKISRISSTSLGKQRIWQVHSLQKRYVEEEIRDARDSIFASLAVAENVHILDQLEDAMTTALCALYLHKHLARRASAKMGFPLEVFNKQKRNAIEPLTRLLALSVSDRWTTTERDCAIKVFLSYVCNSSLENLSISQLLRNSIGAIAMCRALRMLDYAFQSLPLFGGFW